MTVLQRCLTTYYVNQSSNLSNLIKNPETLIIHSYLPRPNKSDVKMLKSKCYKVTKA